MFMHGEVIETRLAYEDWEPTWRGSWASTRRFAGGIPVPRGVVGSGAAEGTGSSNAADYVRRSPIESLSCSLWLASPPLIVGEVRPGQLIQRPGDALLGKLQHVRERQMGQTCLCAGRQVDHRPHAPARADPR